jgi:hypothetical protein
MRRKILLFATGCFALLFILLAAFVLLLPYLVNLEPVRQKVEAFLLQQTGGKVEYQKIDLFYFPRPGVAVRQIRLSVDQKVAGALKSVQVYPEFLPLLKGRLRITRIEIESPDFTIQVPAEHGGVKEKPEDTALKQFKEIIARISGIGPGLRVALNDGRLNLARGPKTVLSFHDIDVTFIGPPGEAKIEVACRSSLWERMSVETTIDPVDLHGHGHVQIARFHPHLLSGLLSSDSPLNVTDSEMNLNIGFETKGQGMLQATLEGSLSKLTFGEGREATAIRGNRLRGAFQMEGERIDISLGELNLEYPRLILSGNFKIDRRQPRILVEAHGRQLEVTSTREVTLRLASKIPVMNTIFDIVREGRIPLVTFRSSGRKMSELDDTDRFSVKGSILDGKISIPVNDVNGNRENLIFEKASGEVVVSKGILEAGSIKAQWKNQPLQGGRLRIGVEGEDAPFHLEVDVETDLSLVPPLLNRLGRDRVLREEMARLRQIEGRAVGRLVMGERLNSIGVKVDIQEMNLVARHERIPYPVTIDRGAFSVDAERLRVRKVTGKVGRSSFSDLTAQLGFEKDSSMEISSGGWVISLDEIYPWLSSLESLKEDLKKIQSVRGEVALSRMKLSGPLTRPGKWEFETAGEMKGLTVSTSLLPEPVAISRGKFNLDQQKITIVDFQTKFLSASLNVSGTLSGYQRGLEGAALSMSGRVTPKDVQWLSDTLGLEPKVQLRSPVGISQAQVSWRKGVDVSLKGDLGVENGPEISLDLLQNADGIEIRRLVVRDKISDASIRLHVKGRAVDLTFSGRLYEKTLDTVLTQFQAQDGWVRGDFRSHIDVDRLALSTAHGRIEVYHLLLPSELGKPTRIDEMTMNARGNHITIERGNIVWSGKRLALSGEMSFSEKTISLDLDLFTESVDLKVDLNPLKEFFNKERKGEEDRNLQLQGALRFKTKSLSYEKFIWSPFYAEILLDPHGAEVVIKEANLCGISIPGSVKITDGDLSLEFRPCVESKEIQSTVSCLFDQELRMTGEFALKGKILAQGKPEELIRSVNGKIEFQAKDGHVYYWLGLVRILEFINATEIYRGKVPILGREGLEFDLFDVRGSFGDGKLRIEEATFDGTTLEMAAKGDIDLMNQQLNLTVLVAPLKTVDRIIKLIPLVREIFAGTLLTIPVTVRGSLKDPTVVPLSPAAIGEEILGIMKRTLRLPFKVIEPFVPRKKEDSSKDW